MKKKFHKQILYLFLAGCFCFMITNSHAQFIMLARKIKSMGSSNTDVATVLLDARTVNVYKAVIDTLTSDPAVKITRRDNAKRLVEFTNGKNSISLQIDSLAAVLTQITVASPVSDKGSKSNSSAAVDVIMKVCQKAGIKCTLSGP